MTSTNYFGKMNSTFGSVVPLAMFLFIIGIDNEGEIFEDKEGDDKIRRTRRTNCQGLKVVSISSITPSTATPSLDNHIPNFPNCVGGTAII